MARTPKTRHQSLVNLQEGLWFEGILPEATLPTLGTFTVQQCLGENRADYPVLSLLTLPGNCFGLPAEASNPERPENWRLLNTEPIVGSLALTSIHSLRAAIDTAPATGPAYELEGGGRLRIPNLALAPGYQEQFPQASYHTTLDTEDIFEIRNANPGRFIFMVHFDPTHTEE